MNINENRNYIRQCREMEIWMRVKGETLEIGTYCDVCREWQSGMCKSHKRTSKKTNFLLSSALERALANNGYRMRRLFQSSPLPLSLSLSPVYLSFFFSISRFCYECNDMNSAILFTTSILWIQRFVTGDSFIRLLLLLSFYLSYDIVVVGTVFEYYLQNWKHRFVLIYKIYKICMKFSMSD